MTILRATALTLAFLCAAVPGYSQANSLPKLPDDPAIEKGLLPNGVTYFLASSKTARNTATYALVQKMDADIPLTRLQTSARENFSSVRYGDVELTDFLGRNGILPTEKGYIDCRSGAVVYTFDNVSSSRGEFVLDTVLLSVFRLAQQSSLSGVPSSSQAIVVAGDFNKSEIMSRMKLLCLLNPNVEGTTVYPEYKWAAPSAKESGVRTEGGAVSRVSVRWRGARVPDKYMETVFPVISEKLSGELGVILRNRLEPSLKDIDLWLDYRHTSSADAFSDETVSLVLHCQGSQKNTVKKILENELDRLFTYGVSEREYVDARDSRRYSAASAASGKCPSNVSYVNRCVSSFLYGASLADDKQKIKAVYRNLPDSTQTRLFNRYLKGMLKQTSRIDSSLTRATSLMTAKEIEAKMVVLPVKSTLKAPKSKTEYISGGTMWTFSTGVNVIYKEVPSDGFFRFAYAAKGGRSDIDAAAFDKIAGVDAMNWRNYLSVKGITIYPTITPFDVRLSGMIPAENIEKLFSVLASLSAGKDRIFGSGTYKLLVITGDMETDKMKKLLCSRLPLLGTGGKWRSGKAVPDREDVPDGLERMLVHNVYFPLDVTTANYATAVVAGYGVRDAFGKVASDYGVHPVFKGGFPSFSSNRYKMIFALRHIPLQHFPLSATRLPEGRDEDLMKAVSASVASAGITDRQLGIYKSMAKDWFASYSATPEYLIDVVLARYLDNKDLMSRFNVQVDAVTLEDVNDFYVAASASDR